MPKNSQLLKRQLLIKSMKNLSLISILLVAFSQSCWTRSLKTRSLRKIYGVSPSTMNWFAAEEWCNNWGGELVEIFDSAENRRLKSFLDGVCSDCNKRFWIEATDLAREGDFHFGLSHTRVPWTNWKSGEPNNANGNEDCVHIREEDGYKWNDIDCSASYLNRALCEKWTN